MIEVSFIKLHEKAQLPKANNSDPETGDTGYDVYGVERTIIPAGQSRIVPTGIKVGYITPGFWFRVEARSGLGFKHDIHPHPGVIDNGYRGDLGIKVYNKSNKDYVFEAGDRVAQLAFYQLIQPKVTWTDKVQNTVRGDSGFGQSGR